MPSTSPPPFPPQPRLDDLLLSDDDDDDEPPSGHATSSTLAHAHARAAPDRSAPDDIEMGTIRAGHRRRRSSILNPIVAPTRARARSLSQVIPLQDEVKEVEEGDAAAAGAGAEGGGSGGAASGGTTDFSEWSGDDEDLRDDEETGLTRKERNRRRRAKRRNTLLDQRVAPEKMSMDEKGEPDETVTRAVLINAGLIMLWYIFSLSISLVSPVPPFPCPCPDTALPRARRTHIANRRMTSITNGCSTTTASILDSRYSRRRRT